MELRIKEVAKEKKVSISTLASMIGITQPNLSNIVNGKSKPSLETLEKIADALEIPITELFSKGVSVVCPHCGGIVPIKIETIPEAKE